MARPWRKKGGWPYVAKSGRKSYRVGFYDHDRVERSRAFPTAHAAREWMDGYVRAERRGPESLRRFLLDLDAKEQNAAACGRTLGEVVELYFALDADPANEGGLAPSTFKRYRTTANCYILGLGSRGPRGERLAPARYAQEIARLPASRFNEPKEPRRWREQMIHARIPLPTRQHAWRVLSAVLSWAAGSHLVEEVQANGCILANERQANTRRSARRGGSGLVAATRRGGSSVASWALSPQAVEAIRAQLLVRRGQREAILSERDAMLVSLQYGLAARNQEVLGMRWRSLSETFAEIVEVISFGELDEWGKTKHSMQRRTAIPSILFEDAERWRTCLCRFGHPAREEDFIVPGNLGGATYGVRDDRTGAVHFSANQAQMWGRKFFAPAVSTVAEQERFTGILGATPYALRRGGISVRLRAEDAQTVAKECGTSLEMLDRHYAFAIDDLRRFGPRPVDIEWRAARAEIAGEKPKRPRLRAVA